MNNEKEPTELQVIRQHCLECKNEQEPGAIKRVRECPNIACKFWRFRLGHRPKRVRATSYHTLTYERGTGGRFAEKKTDKNGKSKRVVEGSVSTFKQKRIIHDFLEDLIMKIEKENHD